MCWYAPVAPGVHIAPLNGGGPPKPPLEVGRCTPATPKHFSRIPATPKHLARERLFLIPQSPRCARDWIKKFAPHISLNWPTYKKIYEISNKCKKISTKFHYLDSKNTKNSKELFVSSTGKKFNFVTRDSINLKLGINQSIFSQKFTFRSEKKTKIHS